MSTHPNHVTAPQADPAIIALMVENAKLRKFMELPEEINTVGWPAAIMQNHVFECHAALIAARARIAELERFAAVLPPQFCNPTTNQ